MWNKCVDVEEHLTHVINLQITRKKFIRTFRNVQFTPQMWNLARCGTIA